jgi:hypothetical protein
MPTTAVAVPWATGALFTGLQLHTRAGFSRYMKKIRGFEGLQNRRKYLHSSPSYTKRALLWYGTGGL